MTKVLIIVGHPRANSFSHVLASAYQQGAISNGADVQRLDVGDTTFDLNVTHHSPNHQPQEPDVLAARRLISWAEHIVFVYPGWWGTMPALLKGFFDRVFVPGFAFEELGQVGQWVPLLKGKTAHLLVTMDTPAWVFRLIYKQPGHNAMKRSILGFCGIKSVKVLTFSPVKDSTDVTRLQWLEQAHQAGYQLNDWRKKSEQREKLSAWLKILRFQFYPMTWIAYTVGALAAALKTGTFLTPTYWLGYLVLFFIEAITVLGNEYFDFESDKRNRNFGPFTGGSRMLVEGYLNFGDIYRGLTIAGLSLTIAVIALFSALPEQIKQESGLLLFAGTVLAISYTVPPLKLVYRGLGEFTVGLTHSFFAILCGYVFQAGGWSESAPWLLSIPLFLATIPAITLSAIPDYDADRAVAKKTLAVIFGPKGAVKIAIAATILACTIGIAAMAFYDGAMAFILACFAIPHGFFFIRALYNYLAGPELCKRMDSIMIFALTFILWFGAVPLAILLKN